ncbi:FAD-binding domain-containing protein [Aaosphaeria arxii CBS 175.79]|uniref:FAD-binding domain-containing protein n=1 Tax=Aaosphaeria arxii CBS 175.79 TaxID=1450172 RepID=A0A6A5XBE5_9PLEO|nr:FAD-binding domain-containing protein [Aaosphaeria arxii CBS 175.79]KAF2010251.1 FAD-binding domain-containing protein [Aaosphaeria arxii CBS 175.79]
MLGVILPVILGLPAALAQYEAIDTCCQALQGAGLQNVLFSGDAAYKNRTESYWSVSAQLTPHCIVQPTSTDDVVKVVNILVGDGACSSTKFAVRSGGHTTWAGSNNIEDGITVDLGLMTEVTFDKNTTVASIGPGSRWNGVYAVLDPLGYTVPGGRAGTVGVAGFLTGGGNSFYAARKGFACDNVVNFELVTADGKVVNANANENADLFQALKGGSGGNFGIVTRFDMQAFLAGNLWGGTATYNKSVTAQQIDAYVKWTDNVENYQAGSSIIFWSYLPVMSDIVILAAYEDTEGEEAPAGFDEFLAIDRIADTLRLDSHKALTDELEQAAGYRDIWFTMTFTNDKEIFTKIVDLNTAFVEEWKLLSADGDFITQCMFQSIPTIFSKHSVERGGNVLGLDKVDKNAIMLLFDIAVKTPEEEALARPLLRSYGRKMQEFAAKKGGLVDWQFLNYADSYQNPLGSYGAENVEKIRAAAAKFDPQGIFQTKAPGGFKISKVENGSKETSAPIEKEL